MAQSGLDKLIQTYTGTNNNYKQPEKIGKYGKFDITLNDGPYGKYVTCDNYKFNFYSFLYIFLNVFQNSF